MGVMCTKGLMVCFYRKDEHMINLYQSIHLYHNIYSSEPLKGCQVSAKFPFQLQLKNQAKKLKTCLKCPGTETLNKKTDMNMLSTKQFTENGIVFHIYLVQTKILIHVIIIRGHFLLPVFCGPITLRILVPYMALFGIPVTNCRN